MLSMHHICADMVRESDEVPRRTTVRESSLSRKARYAELVGDRHARAHVTHRRRKVVGGWIQLQIVSPLHSEREVGKLLDQRESEKQSFVRSSDADGRFVGSIVRQRRMNVHAETRPSSCVLPAALSQSSPGGYAATELRRNREPGTTSGNPSQ